MKKISLIMLAILCLATVASAATVTISTTLTSASKNLGGNSYKCVNMGDGSQTESQKAFAKCLSGTLSNGTLLAPGVDGCWLYGGGSVNIKWADVGEDACSRKSSGGTSNVGGSWSSAADKFMNVNSSGAASANTSGSSFITYMRQSGGSTYTCQLSVGGNVSGGQKGCVTCVAASTCSVSGTIGVSKCKCFKP